MLIRLKTKKKPMCRLLTKDDIECRVAQAGKTNGKAWCSLLLYKDARVDQKVLDSTYGPLNWKRSHELIGDRLYCTVSVWDNEKKEWVSKQDVGTESNTEKEKGQASDSFKRACFNWGIGRELYTAPKIFINLAEGEYDVRGDKIVPKAAFFVQDIGYTDGVISKLILVDRKNVVRFKMDNGTSTENNNALPVIEVGDDAFNKWVEWMAKHWGASDFERGVTAMRQKFTVADDVLAKMKERAEFLADI